ncbi:MAG: dTMP kinase [bacterium]|nr:dTMP kinase [bacterium]
MKGYFFAFEGIDGSGKTTQINLLASKLTQLKKEVIVVREPGGTALAEAVRQILLDKQFQGMNGWSETFLFCAARADLVQRVILPELDKGTIVLADRYRLSTEIYQGIGRNLPLEKVQEVLDLATHHLKPHLTLILDVPLELSLQRLQSENRVFDRMETSGMEFFQRVAKAFREVNDQDIIHLDGSQSIEKISEEIWSVVKQFLELGENE